MTAHRFRTARKGNTTQRGYGNDHMKERRRRLPLHSPADPCGYCGQPLGDDRSSWHLPHNTARTAYLPGFWHAACNRREGAIRGGRKAVLMRQTPRPVRRRNWLR